MHVYMNIHNYVTQGNYAPPEIRLSKKKKYHSAMEGKPPCQVLYRHARDRVIWFPPLEQRQQGMDP
jgi:hypothetical protein